MKIIQNILILFLFFSSQSVFSQVKEGKVSFDITYPATALAKEQLDMLPSHATISFKEDHARMDMKMSMGMSMNTISDPNGTTLLMDIMGNKMAIKTQKEENGKSKAKVTIVDETKMIAGYKCKKAVIEDGGSKFEIWYTDEIIGDNKLSGNYSDIKGFLMEFNMKSQKMDMHMVANTVSVEKVDNSEFEIPADYKLMSEDEMKKMFGGK